MLTHDGQQVIISRETVKHTSRYVNLAHTGPMTKNDGMSVGVCVFSVELKNEPLEAGALRKYLTERGKRESLSG